MVANTGILEGEVSDDPENQGADIEKLLMGFLEALIHEQNPGAAGKDE